MRHPDECPTTRGDTAGRSQARGVVDRILPAGSARDSLLAAMALGIRTAHAGNPAAWALTLPKGERILNLNVGRIFVLRLEGGRCLCALPNAVADAFPKTAASPDAITWRGRFDSLPGTSYITGPHTLMAAAWKDLEQPFIEVVEAAARQLKASSYRSFHSPAALAFLAEATGQTLPHPEGLGPLPPPGASMLEALANRLVKLMARDDEIGAGLRSHAADHARRVEAWRKIAAGPFPGHEALLVLMKDTDWYQVARVGFNPELVGTDAAAMALLNHLAAVADGPLNSPAQLGAAVQALPKSCKLGFLTEVLAYLRPGTLWEMNAPTEQAVAALGYPLIDADAARSPDPTQRYFAIGPLMHQVRNALELAGFENATFMDVDLLLWELARAPQLFPERPMVLDRRALEHLVEDLRARYPSFTTFTDRTTTWWHDERIYKDELAAAFRQRFGDRSQVSSLLADEVMVRLLSLLRDKLPCGEAQNLIGWRYLKLLDWPASDRAGRDAYAAAVRELISSDAPSDERVDRFIAATWPLVAKRDAAKAWSRSIPTLLLMLQDPADEMLVRTDELRTAAKLLTGEDLFSDQPLSGLQYQRVRVFAQDVRDALTELGLDPIDLVDVQGFVYVTAARNAWIFQGNPAVYDLEAFLRAGHRRTSWSAPVRAGDMRIGDEAFLWLAGPDRGIVAHGHLVSEAMSRSQLPADVVTPEAEYYRDREAGPDDDTAVVIELTSVFPDHRITASDIKSDGVLSTLSILRQAAGTVFNVSKPLAHRLREMIPVSPSPSRPSFADIVARLEAAGLHFPPELVANFLLALQTKRFVILTGISGTGKTRLAMAVAEHFPATRTEKRVEAASDDAMAMTAKPYMLKYKRFVVPAALATQAAWTLTDGALSMGRIRVEFESHSIDQSFYHPPDRSLTILLMSGEFREWFGRHLQPGDPFTVEPVTSEGIFTGLRVRVPTANEVTVAVPNRVVVAVRPDWTDQRGLLGFHNLLTGQYVTTPFLELILRAADEARHAADEGRDAAPYFAVLDEMNLARVEHYFSELLSCMESGEALHLHDDRQIEEGEDESGLAIPRTLSLPPNLYLVGTVNVDETAYMFSPKVLDRAFTIELNHVDLAGYSRLSVAEAPATTLGLPAFAGLDGTWVKPGVGDWRAFGELAGGQLRQRLVALNDVLADEGRHFGYRVANEVARFLVLAHRQSDGDAAATEAAFDLAVLEKVLPKLNGTQQELHGLLGRLFAFAVDPSGVQTVAAGDWELRAEIPCRTRGDGGEPAAGAALPRTAAKLLRMIDRLTRRGFVSYIE